MLKRIIILSIILTFTLLTACNDTSQRDKQSSQSNSENQTDVQPKEDMKKPTEQPFEAIRPPEDALPLEEKFSKEERTLMPASEAHGGDPKRSVPLGQTLLEGKKDVSNGPLKNYRLVAFYGTPLSPKMGILGEYPPEEMMKKLKEQTAAYSEADPDRPAVPTIELITTIAQRSPGPDGDYVTGPSEKVIDQYVELAKKHNALLLLDVQLGQAPVMKEVKKLESYLKLPFVHLAIDTEYSVDEGKVPGEDLGHIDGSEIQKAVEYMDMLVEKHSLPDKLVVVHQFGEGIVTGKDKIHPTDDVEVALNYDGFGDAAVKMSAYGKLLKENPIQYGGFKLFYEKDDPLLSPLEVLKLDPAPAIVDYQ